MLINLKTSTSLHRLFRSLSSSAAAEPHFMVGYLVTSCGLTKEKAANAAKRIPRIKSPERPDSVIAFLKKWGFDDTHIRRLVTTRPELIGCDVENRLEPNIRTLLDMGFSRPNLPRVVIRNPYLLIVENIMPRIQFWRTLLGNDDNKLRTALEMNRSLFTSDPSSSFAPKVALLKNHGLSDQQIQRLLLLGSCIFTWSINSIESLLKWTMELGLRLDSSMFVYQLLVLSANGRPNFRAKMEIYNNYGWSELEFISAFKRYPFVIRSSQKSIHAKMEFFVGKAGCPPNYIARYLQLISWSLEKRLMPRNHILQILKAKEVTTMDFMSIMRLSDKMYVEKCIYPFEDIVPGLLDIYENACAGRYLFQSPGPSE